MVSSCLCVFFCVHSFILLLFDNFVCLFFTNEFLFLLNSQWRVIYPFVICFVQIDSNSSNYHTLGISICSRTLLKWSRTINWNDIGLEKDQFSFYLNNSKPTQFEHYRLEWKGLKSLFNQKYGFMVGNDFILFNTLPLSNQWTIEVYLIVWEYSSHKFIKDLQVCGLQIEH